MNASFAKLKLVVALCIATVSCASAEGQDTMPPPGPEMDIFKKDVGDWDCEIKTWAAPGAEAQTSKGSEKGYMFEGGYWLISHFNGNMMGMDFKGHGMYGYDPTRKKYVGTWVDSLGPYMMHTEGDYDKESKMLTMVGDSLGPDGVTTFTYTMATSYKNNGRVMTMYMQPKGSGEDQKMKFFEITYKKKETKGGDK